MKVEQSTNKNWPLMSICFRGVVCIQIGLLRHIYKAPLRLFYASPTDSTPTKSPWDTIIVKNIIQNKDQTESEERKTVSNRWKSLAPRQDENKHEKLNENEKEKKRKMLHVVFSDSTKTKEKLGIYREKKMCVMLFLPLDGWMDIAESSAGFCSIYLNV